MTQEQGIPGKVFASVWDALEDSPAVSANMRLRSDLMIAIRDALGGSADRQAEAGQRLGLGESRVNDLLRGRIDSFSIDELVAIAIRAGLDVKLHIERVAA